MTRLLCVGGSSGIGLATARRGIERGWDVVVASRFPERASIDGVAYLALDVTDTAAVAAALAELGPVDHLVSSTVFRASGRARDLDLGAARQAFEAKFWGPLSVLQHADVRSSVTLLSGVAASTPMACGSMTGAVNGAVEALVRALAVEFAPVRVNAVAPGVIDTPTWDAVEAEQRRVFFGGLADALPLGRIGTADDVAEAVMMCLTNGFMTGEIVHVDGGHRLAAP